MDDGQIGAGRGRFAAAGERAARHAAGHLIVLRRALVRAGSDRHPAGRAERHRQRAVDTAAGRMGAGRQPRDDSLKHEQIGRGDRNPPA